MDFLSQAAAAAKMKVALVNAVGFFSNGLRAHLFALRSTFALRSPLCFDSQSTYSITYTFVCNEAHTDAGQ